MNAVEIFIAKTRQNKVFWRDPSGDAKLDRPLTDVINEFLKNKKAELINIVNLATVPETPVDPSTNTMFLAVLYEVEK